MPIWLLDSGASWHFCFDLNDFIEYQKYKPHKRTSVTTAAYIIYVKGKGTVLLKYKVNNRTVKTCFKHITPSIYGLYYSIQNWLPLLPLNNLKH
jgi:hypothetical protein